MSRTIRLKLLVDETYGRGRALGDLLEALRVA